MQQSIDVIPQTYFKQQIETDKRSATEEYGS